MPVLDLQHAFSDPRNALLGQVLLAKNAPSGGFREEMLRRARENAAKAGLPPSAVDVVFRNATNLAVDPRLSSQSTSKNATLNRIQGHADQLSHLQRLAELSSGDSELYGVASRLQGLSPEEAIASARNIMAALGGQGPDVSHAAPAQAFFSDPAKVQAELARRVAFEQKRFKQAHRSSPFSIVAPIVGGLFGAAIPGIAGGIIGGAIGGSSNGLEGVLKGAFLGGLAKFAAPKVNDLLGSFKPPTVNANAVPGISTGVTTPAGGAAIIGTGQAAPLQGLVGGAPLGASPLAVAGGVANALVNPLPTGQTLLGTNINVGSVGTVRPKSVLQSVIEDLKNKAINTGVKSLANNVLSGRSNRNGSSGFLSPSPSTDLGTPSSASTIITPALAALGTGTGTSTNAPPTSPSSDGQGAAALPVATGGSSPVEPPPLQSQPGARIPGGNVRPTGAVIDPSVPHSVFKGSGLIFPNL